MTDTEKQARITEEEIEAERQAIANARNWLLNGGGGFEGREDGLRAAVWSLDWVLDLVAAYGSSEYERGLRDGREQAAKVICRDCKSCVPLVGDLHLNTFNGSTCKCSAAAIRQISEGATE